MIISILSYAATAFISGVVSVFVYRNNTDLIGKKAEEIDKIWDKLGLTDKIDAIEKKVDEIINKK